MNNANSIIRFWRLMYNKTKNAYWARKIERVTGDYPDGLVSTGYDQEDFQNHKDNYMEMIEESINNPELANIPW